MASLSYRKLEACVVKKPQSQSNACNMLCCAPPEWQPVNSQRDIHTVTTGSWKCSIQFGFLPLFLMCDDKGLLYLGGTHA